MEEVYNFLKKCEVYYLATLDGDKPRVRPFGTVNIYKGRLCIQMGRKKAVSRQISINPYIEICAYRDGTWLRLSATAAEYDDREARISMLEAYPSLKEMYSPDDGNTQVLYLKDAVAEFSSFGTEGKRLSF